MAPEQARSEAVDRRADVFAMGICLWEMLTGERLFKAEGEGETLNRVLYEPIPTPRSVDPDIAPEIDEVCMRALTRDPDARFATAAEFADALERAARALDLLGSHREVAACVNDILGADIKERKAELRAWLGDSERRNGPPSADASGEIASHPGALVSVYVPPLLDSGLLPPVSKASARSTPGPRLLGVAIGLVVIASIGFAFLRRPHGVVVDGAGPEASALVARPTAPPIPDPIPPPHAQAASVAETTLAASTDPPRPLASAATSPSASPAVRSASAGVPSARTSNVAPATRQARGASNVPATSAAQSPLSTGVPADMLNNPYR
jgi:serine/threonine-protein kinase